MRGKNGDIWEYADPVFPQSYSDLTHVSEWVLCRCGELKKRKNRAKNEKLRFAKKLFYFCVFTSWTLFWWSVWIGKVAWGKCACQKIFLTYRHQLRCAVLEISSYKGLIFSQSYFGAQHRCNRSCYLVLI